MLNFEAIVYYYIVILLTLFFCNLFLGLTLHQKIVNFCCFRSGRVGVEHDAAVSGGLSTESVKWTVIPLSLIVVSIVQTLGTVSSSACMIYI